MEFNQILQENLNATNEVLEWCDKIYTDNFGELFTEIKNLALSIQSSEHQISDEELSWALSELPLKLFLASESMQTLKLGLEVTKLNIRKRKVEVTKNISETYSSTGIKITATEKSDIVSAELVDLDMLVSAYTSIINRVESEFSFAREFIMGAKKIYDARRKTELSVPITPVVDIDTILESDKNINQLPNYQERK